MKVGLNGQEAANSLLPGVKKKGKKTKTAFDFLSELNTVKKSDKKAKKVEPKIEHAQLIKQTVEGVLHTKTREGKLTEKNTEKIVECNKIEAKQILNKQPIISRDGLGVFPINKIEEVVQTVLKNEIKEAPPQKLVFETALNDGEEVRIQLNALSFSNKLQEQLNQKDEKKTFRKDERFSTEIDISVEKFVSEVSSANAVTTPVGKSDMNSTNEVRNVRESIVSLIEKLESGTPFSGKFAFKHEQYGDIQGVVRKHGDEIIVEMNISNEEHRKEIRELMNELQEEMKEKDLFVSVDINETRNENEKEQKEQKGNERTSNEQHEQDDIKGHEFHDLLEESGE